MQITVKKTRTFQHGTIVFRRLIADRRVIGNVVLAESIFKTNTSFTSPSFSSPAFSGNCFSVSACNLWSSPSVQAESGLFHECKRPWRYKHQKLSWNQQLPWNFTHLVKMSWY